MSSVKKICISAICIALCAVLPSAFHMFALGSAFSPLHLPVLLCGLVCGAPYGLLCGFAGPILCSLVTGMPTALRLLYMVPELCVYGLVCGLLMQIVHTGRLYADVYLSLVPALMLGRIAGGVIRAVVYFSSNEPYSLALWASSYIVETLPAIILQLCVLPLLVVVLTKSQLIPQRYPRLSSDAAA